MKLEPQKPAQHKNTPQASHQGKYLHSPSHRKDSWYEKSEKQFSPPEPRFRDRLRLTPVISITCCTFVALSFLIIYAFILLKTQRSGIVKCTSLPPSCLMEFPPVQQQSGAGNEAEPRDTHQSR